MRAGSETLMIFGSRSMQADSEMAIIFGSKWPSVAHRISSASIVVMLLWLMILTISRLILSCSGANIVVSPCGWSCSSMPDCYRPIPLVKSVVVLTGVFDL